MGMGNMYTIQNALDDLLENIKVCWFFFDPDLLSDFLEESDQKYMVEMYGFDYKLVHQHGGENKGLNYYTVYEFTDGYGTKQLVKFNGQYHSYVGTEYMNYSFVEAREKKVVCLS